MPIHVEVREARLSLGLLEREGLARKGHAHVVRTRANTDAKLEVLVDALVRVVRARLIPVRLYQKRLRLAPIDTEFDLLWLGQTFDVLVPVASQTDLELVDGVLAGTCI